MAFKMSESSLFAVLLRSTWWYGIAIGIALIAISLVLFGGQFIIFGVVAALPFFVIAGIAGYRQSKLPSRERVQEVYAQTRKMNANQIASKIAAPYLKARYDSEPFKGEAADLLLTRGNRIFLLCAKRFKVGNTGVGPLQKLVAAGEKVEATGYLYVALGDVSAAAVEYAEQNDIELINATKLAAFFDSQANIE